MASDQHQILCAVTNDDLAESVVAAGRRLNVEGGYRVRYVHVADLPSRTVPVYGAPPGSLGFPGYPRDLMVKEADEAGHALLDRLGLDSADAEVVLGDPVHELQRLADETRPELLVLGSRGLGAVRTALQGSVSLDLVRNGERPVLVVPRSAGV